MVDSDSGSRHDNGKDNVVLVHWHDLGRHLELYGAAGARSPSLERLAAQGLLFTNAHAVAPLCSPSRGALLTGRYPQSNGIVGLVHHGWEYMPGVRTLPSLLGEAGWLSALIGMQHESANPSSLGYDAHDVTDSDCGYVVDRAEEWLARRARARDAGDDSPFLLNTGFFEVHRPYPAGKYPDHDPDAITVPDYLPDTPEVRADLSAFHGAIEHADRETGRLIEAIDGNGFADDTWVVFFTDHGEAFPGAKSTLYARGTGISLIIRPPRSAGVAPRRYEDLFSGVDLVPTLLELLGQPVPDEVQGVSHAEAIAAAAPSKAPRSAVFAVKDYHDSYDPIRAIRTADFSYIENHAPRPRLELPLDIADSRSGRALQGAHLLPRSRYELYDLRFDPGETVNRADHPGYEEVRGLLAERLARWRAEVRDATVDVAAGESIARRYMADYLAGQATRTNTVPRSPRGADRELIGGEYAADDSIAPSSPDKRT
ncbi:sulfatase [Corynebacterium xerosis]|uniref:sulfatase n=1 Tax=Corynebacterium xerosis TaxID=1725 RepID=UPI003879A4E6